jgi:hypothetical protein
MQPGELQISTERHQLLALGLAERQRTTLQFAWPAKSQS